MEPFLAQIMLFGGNFAPRGWAFCDGQLLPIASYTALFSLLGTTYGGDGRTTFGLPDLRGRAPIHAGNGPGLSPRRIGQAIGAENTIIKDATPLSRDLAIREIPEQNDVPAVANFTTGLTNQNVKSFGPSNNLVNRTDGRANIMQPSLVVNYIIALQGIFPSRS